MLVELPVFGIWVTSTDMGHMPLYSSSTRSLWCLAVRLRRYSAVISSGEEMVTRVTLPPANLSGSYSVSPSSQSSSSVFSPLEKRGSASVSWIKLVLPLSRKPVNR